MINTNVVGALCLAALVWGGGWGGGAVLDSPVADAAMQGETETVRALLEEGADVNAAQGDGMTALHWAARRGDVEMAEMLIYAGANVEAVTRIGDYTPLHLASQAGYATVVEALVSAGSDPNARTTTGGATPLHFAAASANADAVTVLLDHGAEVNARESAWGQTPLMFAAEANRAEAIAVLMEHGADAGVTAAVVDLPSRDRERRADRQLRNRRMTALRALSVEVGGEQPPAPKEDAERGRPPAARPATGGQPSEAPATGSRRAPGRETGAPGGKDEPPQPLSYADLVGGHGGLTALLHAARQGHVEAARALLDAGAAIDQVSAGDHTSPMLIATINGHFDLALELLRQGADPNLASDAGAAPLYAALNAHWAPKARFPQQHAYERQQATYLDVMEALLEAGADPNARLTKHLWYMSYNFDLLRVDTKGATPFWRAAYATDVTAMRLLIAHGADPNIATQKVPPRRFRRGRGDQTDHSGVPPVPVGGPAVYPIHAASGVGYGEGFAGNAHRHVPGGWVPTVKYLVEELGADVNARDHNGYTALHHAAARGDTTLIRYLVEHGADVTVVSRRGQTTADMANGPVQRIQPFPEAVALLESLGSKNNHNCVSC